MAENSEEQGAQLATFPARTITRARADETVVRIDEIESLMTGGEWHTGKSHRALATKWGVSVVQVEKLAAEAGRRIRKAVDTEAVTGAILAGLDTVLNKAFERQGMSMSGELYDNPDLRSAVAALELRAKLLGLITSKVEAKVGAYQQLSDAELEARILDEAKRIEEKRGA